MKKKSTQYIKLSGGGFVQKGSQNGNTLWYYFDTTQVTLCKVREHEGFLLPPFNRFRLSLDLLAHESTLEIGILWCAVLHCKILNYIRLTCFCDNAATINSIVNNMLSFIQTTQMFLNHSRTVIYKAYMSVA